MRRIVVLLMSLGLLALAGLFATPVQAGGGCHGGFEDPPRTTGNEAQIKMAPCSFAPTVTVVAPGSTVTFFNGPDLTHLITGANAEWGSRDVEVKPGAEVSYTFDKPGIYPYACALHRGMSGTIVVGDVASAVGAGLATGATGAGTTAGGTTAGGTTAGGTSGQAPAASTEPTTPSGIEPFAIVAGAGAGWLAGAAAVWLAMRRRRTEMGGDALGQAE
jgi:plastocyanin